MNENYLIAIDPSPASQKAVDYVARILRGPWEGAINLVHVLTPEESAEGDGGQAREKARGLLESLRGRLTTAGLSEERIDLGFLAHDPRTTFVDGLLDLARDHTCETIVVGRNSLPWYREVFHHHPADELVRHASGFTVWIVE